MHLIICYAQQYKEKSKRVLRAFAEGCNAHMALTAYAKLDEGEAAFYGVRPAWQHLWEQAKQENRTWYYLDNSWFDCSREAYFRIGINSLQSWSRNNSDGNRMRNLGIKIQDWRTTGSNIVVCPQSDEFMGVIDNKNWLADTLKLIKSQTDRRIVIRTKQSRPLWLDLKDAYMTIAHSSMASVESLIAGVPIIVTDKNSAAHAFTSESIEKPALLDGRTDLIARLADSQWTLNELKEGIWQKAGLK